MKILLLTNHLNANDGWSRYSFDIAKEFQNQGHEILCLVYKASKQTRLKELVLLEAPLKYPANPMASFRAAFSVSKIIRSFSPDIIHFMVEPYAAILPFIYTGKKKVFITAHGTYSFIPAIFHSWYKKKIADFFIRKAYKKTNSIIAVSHYTKNHLLKYFPCNELNIKVITNGVEFQEGKISEGKGMNTTRQILFVGAIKPRKGILNAIESLNCYKNKFSKDFRYNIIGRYDPNDNYYKQIIFKINEYGLNNHIFLKGEISEAELDGYYKHTDLFLMLPVNIGDDFEGFGLVYLEASARGIPCIGSTGCGAKDAIFEGNSGYSCEPEDYEGIAERIDLILNKKMILRKNCFEWAKKNNVREKVAKILTLYSGTTLNCADS